MNNYHILNNFKYPKEIKIDNENRINFFNKIYTYNENKDLNSKIKVRNKRFKNKYDKNQKIYYKCSWCDSFRTKIYDSQDCNEFCNYCGNCSKEACLSPLCYCEKCHENFYGNPDYLENIKIKYKLEPTNEYILYTNKHPINLKLLENNKIKYILIKN